MKTEPKPTFMTEFRIEKGEGGPKIVGYAAVFNSWSEDLGGFREKIDAGAFKASLKRSDARALFNHNPDYVLGRQSSGTLKLKEDKDGLWMEIDPPNTAFARDLMTLIERGDINQQSFGFTIKKESWDFDDDESKPASRTLVEVDRLFDVSPVTYPAYPDTSVSLRMLNQARAAHTIEDHGPSPEVEPAPSRSDMGKRMDEVKRKQTELKQYVEEEL